jgi:hypothetical protein
MNPFSNQIEENGMSYYILPQAQPLFKATKQPGILLLHPGQLSFFGVKNMSLGYIEDYEEEYGVIFEFITTRVYKLLALDDPSTQHQLYASAPPLIQEILERNYGFETGIRDSQSGPDRELSMYLCSKGYDGYAIQNMRTDMGGIFHPEFMICDVSGIQYVGQITPPNRAQRIIEEAKMRRVSDQSMLNRKKGRLSFSPPPSNSLAQMGSPVQRMSPGSLFGNDDFDDEIKFEPNISRSLFGGKKRRRNKTAKKSKKSKKGNHYRKKGTTKRKK